MRLMYINGEFTKGRASEEIEVTNPATEEVLDTFPCVKAEEFTKGWFCEPTVLITREETFGPAVPLMGYTSFEEAIDLVNDSPYGLGAVLLSGDQKKIKSFFEDVKAGTIWINDSLTDNYAGPFGG